MLLTPEGNSYIPFLETDFIFSAIAQELGLAGAAGVILLYHLRLPGLPHLDAGRRRVLQAPRRRADSRVAIQAFIIIGV